MIEKVNLKQTLDHPLAFYEGRLGNGIMAGISFPSPEPGKSKENGENQAALLREFTDASIGEHLFRKYSSSGIPSLSIDACGMCAADINEQYGLEQHRRIVAHYGGGQLHIHENGRRLCYLVARIKGLNYCSMGNDVGFPPARTVVGELKKRMHPVPIGVGIPRDAFLKGLKEKNLPGGVMYGLSAESLSEANKIMEQVFEYKSPA